MTTKQVSVWDFPRLIPGVQSEQTGHSVSRYHPNCPPYLGFTSIWKGNEIRGGDKSFSEARPKGNELHRCCSAAAQVLLSDKLILAAQVMRRGAVVWRCIKGLAGLGLYFRCCLRWSLWRWLVCTVTYKSKPFVLVRLARGQTKDLCTVLAILVGSMLSPVLRCPSRFSSN